MAFSTVTSKGQITIPKKIRDGMRLRKGDRVSFRMRRDGAVEMRQDDADLRALRGLLGKRRKGVTVEDMEEAIAKGATRE